MSNYPRHVLVDAGPLIAYYNKNDDHHIQIYDYFQQSTSQLITTEPCITEAMHNIAKYSSEVQGVFLRHIASGVWQRESLLDSDYQRIDELREKYKDMSADFADLSLVAISERLNIADIVTLDKDFDIYRRFGNQHFIKVFHQHTMRRGR